MIKASLYILVSLVVTASAFGQGFDSTILNNAPLTKQLDVISKDPSINADSACKILKAWNRYPDIKRTASEYLFIYTDTFYGAVPLRIFIPANYKSTIPASLLLILHGAVGQNNFESAYKRDSIKEQDIFFNFFSKQNMIIVRPFGDAKKKFDWVVNRFKGKTNLTYNTLDNVISQLKQFLNIDDNKVFALGHSDGSDGVFGLDVYKPSGFAGFVCYNSLLNNIFANDIYLKNTINRPLYLVHSDLDDIRPIQETRLVVKVLDSVHTPLMYKEYTGYQHYDKHLQMDMPYSSGFINKTSRNPFNKNIYWETDDYSNNTCDWIKITTFDTSLPNAVWHQPLSTIEYDKIKKVYRDYPSYRNNKSAAVNASYVNNTFDIQTSRVKEVEVLISLAMVNLKNPIRVKINGKQVFNERVFSAKAFIINGFKKNFDRIALWVTSIKLKVE